MALVYHRINPDFGSTQGNFPTDFQLVAQTHSENLEEIFQLTNHIDHDWTENEGVTAITKQVRSTSVGDVVVLGNGEKHLCEAFGWMTI